MHVMTRHAGLRFVWGVSLFSAACASAGRGPGDFTPSREHAANLLTATELQQTGVASTVDAVRRLRPDFLRSTSVLVGSNMQSIEPAVYVNEVYGGGLAALSLVPLGAVEDICFLRPAQAHDYWGASCPCSAGVIHVRTRREGQTSSQEGGARNAHGCA